MQKSRKQTITKEQIETLVAELTDLADSGKKIIDAMKDSSREDVFVDGYPAAIQSCGRISTFIANALGRANMKPSRISDDIEKTKELLAEKRKTKRLLKDHDQPEK